MNPYTHLSEEERIKQIGELLATAALRYLRREDQERREKAGQLMSSAPTEIWQMVDDDLDKQILRYLEGSLRASPKQISSALHIPRMTLARRLARLRKVGFVVVIGKTRSARYEIANEAHQRLKESGNMHTKPKI